MSVTVVSGNIFTSQCQTLVNTVNCMGVMGAGIALECRLRYPQMHDKYIQLCEDSKIEIGLLWIYRSPERWILNFPTKKHWKYPSKKEYLHAGLAKFLETYREREISSIAFPLLGADKGGIRQEESLDIMLSYLERADIDIEIYRYDKAAKDDLYDITRQWLLSQNIEQLSASLKLRKDYLVRVIDSMQSPDIVQLNQLGNVKGIGIRTLEKVFSAAQRSLHEDEVDVDVAVQKSLF